jgi:thymidylate synthase ThyX
MIEAQVVLDSVSPAGHRLTTLQLRYPKFVHGELMTHRAFSRNASSSRAVPTARLLEEVRDDALRAAPIHWGKNQPGMAAAGELDRHDRMAVEMLWRVAARQAADVAELMLRQGAHKQLVNRVLEPFLHINVLVTATDWANFLTLRCHPDAQPEMHALGVAIRAAREGSTPQRLQPGQWHLPFVDEATWQVINDTLPRCFVTKDPALPGDPQPHLEVALRVSTARCARVSYLSHETGRRSTVAEDLALYDRLVGAQPLHASPAEHQATPDLQRWNTAIEERVWAHPEQWGNLTGWRQHRKLLPGEVVPEPRYAAEAVS